MRRVALGVVLAAWATAQAAAQAPTPTGPAWSPFTEFAFLLGAWSGTATSGERIGGRITRFAMELDGTFLVERASALFPAGDGKPEESEEEIGYVAYDRAKRTYVATYFFSTGVFGTFDVEFLPGGAIRMTAAALGNYEAGARSRILLTPRADGGLDSNIEIALPGKDFVAWRTSSLKKK
ncbi:MAG: hypothetical protein ACM3JH_04340 [Acidithiobacillales bacterium]